MQAMTRSDLAFMRPPVVVDLRQIRRKVIICRLFFNEIIGSGEESLTPPFMMLSLRVFNF
jgi:hypothetical protein